MQRSRGVYSCPGPNFVWHVDGHMKLVNFGIEIYGAIDGYSRYAPWIYVGITARTAVSVYQQYLEVIKKHKLIPQVINPIYPEYYFNIILTFY